MASTEPYVQALAEALSSGRSRPSSRAESETFEFALTEKTVHDLVWLSEMAEAVYHLHSTMKRCAKGESVLFISGDIPRVVPDNDLDDAIKKYDARVEHETANLLQAVGVTVPSDAKPGVENMTIGGLLPYWGFIRTRKPPSFSKTDPLPALPTWIDLDRVNPLCEQNVLTRTHVALIALLWSCFNIVTRNPSTHNAVSPLRSSGVTLSLPPRPSWQ
jgi:hypothetical protein